MSAVTRPFHLAFPVRDLEQTRRFYCDVLGCTEGRSQARWADFNLYGHQIVAHQVDGPIGAAAHQTVDADPVPVPHFGVVLSMPQWHELVARLRAADVRFVIEPHIRFAGQPGEQATLFFHDPSGNALEFKAFEDLEQLFAT